MKKKISELKCELTENIEEDKKVAQLRKTLNSVAPLLEDLASAEPSRKSTLKRLGMYFYKKIMENIRVSGKLCRGVFLIMTSAYLVQSCLGNDLCLSIRRFTI